MADANHLTAERLRDTLHYDPISGLLTRRFETGYRGCHKAGKVAGCANGQGYLVTRVDKRLYLVHRLAWLHMTGEWPPHQIDHINGVRDDNRWANLRAATNAQNCQNLRNAKPRNLCGLLGVSIADGRPCARIQVDRKVMHLGRFDTPEEAHAAYLQAKADVHPYQTLV